MKKMRIKIGKDGRTTVRVEGAAGEECLEFTRSMEQALGAVEKRVMCEGGMDDAVIVREQQRVNTK